MTAYLSSLASDLLAEMNGADLVACGILAVLALYIALWALLTLLPIAWQWLKVRASRIRSAFTRWHVAQIKRANSTIDFEDRK